MSSNINLKPPTRLIKATQISIFLHEVFDVAILLMCGQVFGWK